MAGSIPPLPEKGNTDWYAWASAVHAAAIAAVGSSDGTVLDAVKLTQAQYDAITTKVPTTLYVIVG